VSGSQRFYLKSITRRWVSEIERAQERVLLFFPFLSPKTVKKVLGGKRPPCCEVYTLFRAEHFANGASSLDALKILLGMGVRLYSIDRPMLHAKVLLVPGKFVSVGSQNLTQQGRRNREATVAFTSQSDVALVYEKALGWVEHATPITNEGIQRMEELIGPLREKFADAREVAKRIDRELRKADRSRRIADRRQERVRLRDDDEDVLEQQLPLEERQACWREEDRNAEELLDRLIGGVEPDVERLPHAEIISLPAESRAEEGDPPDDVEDQDGENIDESTIEDRPLRNVFWHDASPGRLASFRESIRRAPKSRRAVEAEVRPVVSHGRRKPSLVAPSDFLFTSLMLEEKEVPLKPFYRYLCLLDDKWGWARVTKKRISFIANGLRQLLPLRLAGAQYRLTFNVQERTSSNSMSNLKVSIVPNSQKSDYPPLLEADCSFELESLRFISARKGKPMAPGGRAADLNDWLSDNRTEFEGRLLNRILSPFKYAKNLGGERADAFFGPEGTKISVRLAAMRGHHFLVAERSQP